MATHLYANNAAGTLVAGITNVQTTLTMSAPPTQFPSPGAGQDFYATITDAATQTLIEIVLVTAVAGNVFTIVRGQDGTSALSWNAGDIVSQRVVAAELRGFSVGSLINIQVFTASGTYTPTSGANKAIIRAVGAGGAGGSVTFTPGGASAVASGGNAGAPGELYIATGLTSQTVTIGAAGAPGAQGNFPGGAGGATSFGTLMVCAGGQGGLGGTGTTPPALNGPNTLGSTVSGAGTITTSGRGGIGAYGLAPNLSGVLGGSGADAQYGQGGTGGGAGAGAAAQGFGAGGGGAGQGQGAGAGAQGGSGAPGLVVVYEFS